jgi:hypothetical protein
MTIHCRIGIVNEDGSVDSIYCHYDGYLQHMAPILTEAYSTEDAVRSLLVGGDLDAIACNKHGDITPVRGRWVQGIPYATFCPSIEYFNNFYKTEYMYLFYYGRWVVSLPQHGAHGPGKYYTLEEACKMGIL